MTPPTPVGPAWTPFDPGDPPALPLPDGGSGRVVAIVATSELIRRGWAASVAVELARAWAATAREIVLVDTDLHRPTVHEALGVTPTPGLAEMLAGATPITEATRAVQQDRLYCVPAGASAADPLRGFAAGRWTRLCRAFSGAGITVLAHVPADAPWAEAVLEAATDVVWLVERGDVAPADPRGLAVLGPLPREARTSGGVSASSSPAEDLEGPANPPPRGEATAGPRREVRSRPEEGRSEQVRPRGRGARRSRRRALVTGALATAAIALVVTLRLGPRSPTAPPDPLLVGGAPGTSADPPLPATSDSLAAVPDARPVPPSARFSVAVAAYLDPAAAEAHARAGRRAAPGVPWLVVPVTVAGAEYHRVMAGLVADSAAARGLVETLTETLGAEPSDWVIRETALVFDLGDPGSRPLALREAERLRALEIPASVAEVRYTDGSIRYRVYAGGYASGTEAAHLGAALAAHGLEARLTLRMGLPIP